MSKQEFTASCLETALWTGTHYATEDCEGVPLDHTELAASNLCPLTLAELITDCEAFYMEYSHLWDDDKQAGHDFHLTRNGHGAGFWDGDYPEHGDKLTEACEPYGTFELVQFGPGVPITHHN